jgi:GTP-binding protein
MLEKPRWLVLNKGDLLDDETRAARAAQIVEALDWKDRWFVTSAIGREGTWPVVLQVQRFFDDTRRDADEAAHDAEERARMARDDV